MYSIYKAKHGPTGKIYVGCTKEDLKCRIGQHWGMTRNKRKKFQIFLHSTEMSEWEWTTLHTVATSKEARDCEIYYIRLWDLYSTGLNSKTGNMTNERRAYFSEKMKQYRKENPEPWHKGRKQCYSEESLRLMSIAKLKNPTKYERTEEHKQKLRDKLTNQVQVKELTTDKVFNSISEAARFFNLRREQVRDVVSGKRKHTAGLIFIKQIAAP